MKYPRRGGKNLSERFLKLDRALKAREAQTQDIYHISQPQLSVSQSVPNRSGKTVKTFQGFVIPEQPKPPEADGKQSVLLR